MARRRIAILISALALGLGALAGATAAAEVRSVDPAAAGAAAVKPASGRFDFERDPPRGAVSCGKRVTVRASARCNGRPATIIGGCSSRGQKRRTQCQ